MIVFVHCPFPGTAGDCVQTLARFAVPFFLMISGYFVCDENFEARVVKKTEDTLKIIFYAGFACIIWNCLNSCLAGGSLTSWAVQYLDTNTLIELLLFNRAIFINSVFYYFFMLLYVYVIVGKAGIERLTKSLPVLIIPLTAAALFILNCTDLPWYYAGNWLLTGLPLFCLGSLMRRHGDIIGSMRGIREILLLASGMVLSLIEMSFEGLVFMYAGSVIMAAALLIICINHPHPPEGRGWLLVSALGTECSLGTVLYHCQIRSTLEALGLKAGLCSPLLIAVLSLCFAYAVSKSKNSLHDIIR